MGISEDSDVRSVWCSENYEYNCYLETWCSIVR